VREEKAGDKNEPNPNAAKESVGCSGSNKKRKASCLDSPGSKDKDRETNSLTQFSLENIRASINELCKKVPSDSVSDDPAEVRLWARRMQIVIEEFNLLLGCVSPATYKWGSDRSGAADQNLVLLCSEIQNAQDVISSLVVQRLTNVLAPCVDLVISSVTAVKDPDKGTEVRTNAFKTELSDPDFVRLCEDILTRNAKMVRQVVLSNFKKIEKVMGDYLKATKKDNQHDRSFTY